MRPAFSSPRHQLAFALAVVLALAAPLLAGKKLLGPRRNLYASSSWATGAFPYLTSQIFDEKEDIDIAFMGCSPIWWGVDTEAVQQALTEKLGRPAVVRTLCWNWQGLDPFYFIAQDLLRHRRVRMMVFCDMVSGARQTAHSQTQHWFRWADNAADLDGLDPRAKVSFYGSALLGLPRDLLAAARPELPALGGSNITVGTFPNTPNPALHLGSLAQKRSLLGPFTEYTPAVPPPAGAVRVLAPDTRAEFAIGDDPLWAIGAFFAGKLGSLAAQNHVTLVYLNLNMLTDARIPAVPVPDNWTDKFHVPVEIAGASYDGLFAGMGPEEVKKLYWNFEHFNANGQKYFTAAVTPALLQLYATKKQF